MLKIAYSESYNHDLGKNHRFPMVKYDLIPRKLVSDKVCKQTNFFDPKELDLSSIFSTHNTGYFKNLINLTLSKNETRSIGFPLTLELIEREKKIAQGTIECCLNSLKYGVSLNIAGGTHHAFRDKPGAFCMLNDQAIAANFLLDNNYYKQILIVDLDVHQGDGTASIFKNDDRVFTLSFHGKKNYPFRKENSDLDCEFDDGTTDKFYLKKLKTLLPILFDRIKPQFVFYLAGVDVLENDKLGRLSISTDGCKERDRIVMEICKNLKIPLQISMGGGYCSSVDEIVEAHCNTFKIAQQIYFEN